MRENFYLAAVATMIMRSAGRSELWAVSSKRYPEDCTDRVWWFGYHEGERISLGRGFTDKEAIVWLERSCLIWLRRSVEQAPDQSVSIE